MGETDQLAILDKPALLDCQPSRDDRPSVAGWLQAKYGFAGLVHRLDFGTSGLLACAKTPAGARVLTQALQDGRIHRTYTAVALGKNLPDEGRFNGKIEGKDAATRFRVLERFAAAALVECELETGRKHQIRRHFAEAGHPLAGDHLYGNQAAKLLFKRPALHASKLRIDIGLDDEPREYRSPLPPDILSLIQRLKAGSAATRS